MTASKTVTLVGDVTIKAPIVIPNGITLTIKKEIGKPLKPQDSNPNHSYATIYLDQEFAVPSSANVYCVFEVQEGGTLKIIGNDIDSDFIAIKGSTGCEFDMPITDDDVDQHELVEALYATNLLNNHKVYPNGVGTNHFFYDFRGPVTGTSGGSNEYDKAGAVIYCVGTLEMNCAKIASAFSRWDGAAIKRPTIDLLNSNTKFGTMTLENVHIRNCCARSAPAILIYNQRTGSKGMDNTPESCKTVIKNSKIFRNYARSTGVCGMIRTGGGVVGNLEMSNTTLYRNFARGYAGGLLASGQAVEETTTKIDGCKFHHNQVLTYAGGAMFSGSFEFTGSTTEIYGNKAATYGGGLYIISYNGVSFSQPKELTMQFNNKLEVYQNSAQSGGGMCMYLRDLTSLAANSTINLDIAGTQIYENNATGNGGGIFLSYNNTKLNVNLNVKSGRISDNTAGESGGGIYCQIGSLSANVDDESTDVDVNLDPLKCKIKLNGGEIYKNTSTEGGGGITVSKLPIYCDENASGIKVYSNVAGTNGGGIYVMDGASFEMNSGQIYSNSCEAATSEGGGIFCTGGSTMNISNGVIGGETVDKANTAYNGGGIFLDNGSLTMAGGSISHNSSGQNGGGIYVKTASFTLDQGEVSANVSAKYGAGIYLANANSSAIVNNGTIRDNVSTQYGGGVYVTDGFCEINGGTLYKNSGTYGGGIFVHSKGQCNLTGGSISENIASTGGGGIFAYGSVDIAGDAMITGNKANGAHATNAGGGGIQLAAEGTLIMHDGSPVISGNTAVLRGGGIRLRNDQPNVKATIYNGTISGNSAPIGGGISVEAGELVLNGGTVGGTTDEQANTATTSGGGVYLDTGTLMISGGAIAGNKSHHGAGVYVNSCAKLHFEKKSSVKSNVATGHGGGIYIKTGNDINFSDGSVSGNSAVEGGGMYVANGAMTLSGANVDSNQANRGGGVLLAEAASLTFSSGAVSGNKSVYEGAGLYLKGTSSCNFSRGNVDGNVAANGGGVYMLGDSKMNFSNGIIRNNQATTRGSGYGTALNNDSNIRGAGGGLYLTGNAAFTFDQTSAVGLYSNTADQIGDDLVVTSKTAKITLPDVSQMNLSDYDSKTPELYWVEDYMTNDTGYPNISSAAPAGYKAVRYRDAIAAQSKVYPLTIPSGGKTYTNTYLALSLGYEIIYVTLKKIGLQPGESAIFRISKVENDASSTPYIDLLVTGNGGELTKKVALYSGNWKVEETGWSWAYDSPASITRSITGSSTAQDKIFVFENQKREGLPLHHEDIVVNDFDKNSPTTSSYINTGQIKDLNEKSQQMK